MSDQGVVEAQDIGGLPSKAGESHVEKTSATPWMAYRAWRMEEATVPVSILLCSRSDSVVRHVLHVTTLGEAADAAAEIPHAIALPLAGGR
jgi:hypothetical protein